MSLSTEVVVALITGTIGFITGVAAIAFGWFNVRDLREIIAAQRQRIDDLEKEVRERKARELISDARISRYLKRIAYLTEGIRTLLEQIRRHKEPPCWSPVDWDPDKVEG